jgi:hypothetical protein
MAKNYLIFNRSTRSKIMKIAGSVRTENRNKSIRIPSIRQEPGSFVNIRRCNQLSKNQDYQSGCEHDANQPRDI